LASQFVVATTFVVPFTPTTQTQGRVSKFVPSTEGERKMPTLAVFDAAFNTACNARPLEFRSAITLVKFDTAPELSTAGMFVHASVVEGSPCVSARATKAGKQRVQDRRTDSLKAELQRISCIFICWCLVVGIWCFYLIAPTAAVLVTAGSVVQSIFSTWSRWSSET
jgi:hypothetical protein